MCIRDSPYGVKQGYVPDLGGKGSIRGSVMSGMVRDYLQDVCSSANTLWSIQDGKVVVVPETAYVPGAVPVVSHDPGLVGMPEQTEKGIKLRMLLNPSIRVGGLIHLDNSRIREYGYEAKGGGEDGAKAIDYSEQRRISGDGYYYVMETEHLGNTRDNDWYTAVSYTHLDVYKRQPERCAVGPGRQQGGSAPPPHGRKKWLTQSCPSTFPG